MPRILHLQEDGKYSCEVQGGFTLTVEETVVDGVDYFVFRVNGQIVDADRDLQALLVYHGLHLTGVKKF